MQVDAHLFASFVASQTAIELASLLPHIDLIEELKDILQIQHDVLHHMMSGKHYGTDNIKQFVDACIASRDHYVKLKELPEWKNE